MKNISLNNTWFVHEGLLSLLDCTVFNFNKSTGYKCTLPCDIHEPLIENNIIKDPVLATYSFDGEWTAGKSWWFTKTFHSDEVDLSDDVIELVFEQLDTNAMIYLNKQLIGSHQNVHAPFVMDIKEYIIHGENTLTVRLTSGLELVEDNQLSEMEIFICTERNIRVRNKVDARRAYVRHPQYSVGWDWGPKAVTCGITGNAYLRCYKSAAIREVYVTTKSIGETAKLEGYVNIENFDYISTKNSNIKVEISYDNTVIDTFVCENLLLTSGNNYLGFTLSVDNPKLWWPRGYGEHPLYSVKATLMCEGNQDIYPEFTFGIKTVTIDTSIIKEGERAFTFIINGVPIFAKGSNWIPSDSIYTRVTDEKYIALINEAVEENFNMLRVWGGAVYEHDIFYNLCDENGLMVWHDFMFACAAYPDHEQWFRQLAYEEMDYQTKRLRNHASLVIITGNNECHQMFSTTRKASLRRQKQFGLYITNNMAKEIMYKNCPNIPYWNSSPYGGELANGSTGGDIHFWKDGYMHPDIAVRIDPKTYDTITAKFVSEYGHVGPCCMETIKEYFDGNPVEIDSEIWTHHANQYEKDTVLAGIVKHYLEPTEIISVDDYVFYGGIVHNLMLEYSLESIRFKDYCAGALYWMFNDAWGEIGWTTLDYYLRRKPSFYGVRRAFAPVKLILRQLDNKVVLQGCNDTNKKVSMKVRYGYVSFDGTIDNTQIIEVELLSHTRTYLYESPIPDYDFFSGTIIAQPVSQPYDTATLKMHDFKNLNIPKAGVKIEKITQDGENVILTLSAETYLHAVHIKGNAKCSDNYFDLYPNETKTIVIEKMQCKDIIVDSIK